MTGEDEENLTPFQTWRKRKAEFIDMTTLHGLRRAGDETRKISALRRHTWALFIAIGLGAIIVITLDQIEEYRKHPTSTKTTIKYSQQPLLFPAVTICSLNRFYNYDDAVTWWDREQMEAYDLAEIVFSDDLPLEVLETELLAGTTNYQQYLNCDEELMRSLDNNAANNPNTSIPYVLRSMLHIRCGTHRKTKSAGAKNFVKTTKKLFDDYGFDIRRSLLSCKFGNGRSKRCSTEDFLPTYSTKYGRCWTFNFGTNNNHTWYQTHDGITAGIKLEFINPQEAFIAKRLQNSLIGTGLKITLHDPDEPPDVDESGFFVGPGFHSFAQIAMTREEYVKPPWGSCIGQHKKFQPYTRNRAEHDCFRNLSLRNCNCLPASFLEKTEDKICTPTQLALCMYKVKWNANMRVNESVDADTEVFTKEWRGCTKPPACVANKYKASVSSVVWPSLFTLQTQRHMFNTSEEKLKRDYLVLDVYFPEMKYYQIKEVTLIYFTNLLSKFGGTMGLFLGASVLTVMELAELFLLYCKRHFDNTKNTVQQWQSSPNSSTSLLPKRRDNAGRDNGSDETLGS